MFSVASKKLGNASEAEEIVQDIFLDLWKRRGSLQLTASVSSYLSVAVNYRVLKVLARRQLYARYKESASVFNEVSFQIEPLFDFEVVKDRLLHLVSKLPNKCRQVFRMSREQEMSGKEIARELSISEKTVESHITKALHHLKTGFGSLLLLLFTSLLS